MIVALGGIPVRPGKGTKALEEAVQCLQLEKTFVFFQKAFFRLTVIWLNLEVVYPSYTKKVAVRIIPFAIYGGYEAWPYNRAFTAFA